MPTFKWGCLSFSSFSCIMCVCVCVCVCVCMLSHFSRVQLCATLWTVNSQAPLSMGFSRKEYWSGLPCPLPGDYIYIYIVCAYIITYCLFTLLIVSFGAQKFSISMNFIYVFFLYILSSVNCVFWSHIQGISDVFLFFFFHFWSILSSFLYMVLGKVPASFFCLWRFNFSRTSCFVEKKKICPLPHWMTLTSLSKIILPCIWGFISGIFVPLIYLSVFIYQHHTILIIVVL